jgi:hypothetical protein
MTQRWPAATATIVEDKANGPAIVDALRNELSGIVPMSPRGSKLARAQAAPPDIPTWNARSKKLLDTKLSSSNIRKTFEGSTWNTENSFAGVKDQSGRCAPSPFLSWGSSAAFYTCSLCRSHLGECELWCVKSGRY